MKGMQPHPHLIQPHPLAKNWGGVAKLIRFGLIWLHLGKIKAKLRQN